ncbi:hypothetical protein FACS189493_7880 [Spirochaetia bacterium]|nr:hypothetical protein FACS189493_7880 [Spirochaetia bacterium]
MKRRIHIQCISLALILLTLSCASAPAPLTETTSEFPQWARDLRRGEIIFFGSFPFAFFLSTTVMDLYRASQHDWDLRYAPWPAKSAGAVTMTTDEYIITISAALGGSLLISLADAIIVKIKRDRAAREAARLSPGEPIIIRRPWPEPPEEVPDEGPSPDEAATPPESDPAPSGTP